MKLSNYTNIIRAKGCYLLHNTLYQSVVRVSDNEAAFIDHIADYRPFEIDTDSTFHQTMVDLKMFVDENVDEYQLANYYAKRIRPNYLCLTLIVTRQCNFRCPYCYEEHENRVMSDTTYNAVILFIEDQIQKYNYDGVQISLFGGEPTLEYESIVRFLKKVKKILPQGTPLVASMTTNGYLLDIDRFKELVNCGVIHYQITIDGIQSDHDQTRVLAGGKGSWHQIILNLRHIRELELNFTISIRTNFTPQSIKNADEFYAYISSEFGKDPRFSVHYECARNLGGERVRQMDLYDSQASPLHTLAGIAAKYSLPDMVFAGMITRLGGSVCYAAKDFSYVVDCDGTLKKCTVCLDSKKNEVGKIQNDGSCVINPINDSYWTTPNIVEECFKCSIYPICLGKKCPNNYNNPELCSEYKEIYYAYIEKMWANINL